MTLPEKPPGSPATLNYASGTYSQRRDWEFANALICGAMLCVPFITGILAILLGLHSLRDTTPKPGERIVIYAGIMLGVLNIVLWSAVSLMP
jgi:hypothetical protein